jgi:hypothetical protein
MERQDLESANRRTETAGSTKKANSKDFFVCFVLSRALRVKDFSILCTMPPNSNVRRAVLASSCGKVVNGIQRQDLES